MKYNDFKEAFEAEVGKEKSEIVFKDRTIDSFFRILLSKWLIISFRFLLLLFYFVSAYFELGWEEAALCVIFAHFIRGAIPDKIRENNKFVLHFISIIIFLLWAIFFKLSLSILGVAIGISPLFHTKNPFDKKK